MKLNLYCTCGGALQLNVPSEEIAQALRQRMWEPMHSGAGHAPTDAKVANRARMREEDRYAREQW